MLYGLNDDPRDSACSFYNHELFNNMATFEETVWEINLDTHSLFIMHERTQPDHANRLYPSDELLTRGIIPYLRSDDVALWRQYTNTEFLLSLTESLVFDAHVLMKPNEYHLMRFVITPAKLTELGHHCCYLSARDMQDGIEEELTQKLNEITGLQNEMLSALSNAVTAISEDGDILVFNQVAEKFLGTRPRNYTELRRLGFERIDTENQKIILNALQTLKKPGDQVTYHFSINSTGTSQIYLQAGSRLLVFPNGPTYVLSVYQDVSEYVQAQKALVRETNRFRKAIEAQSLMTLEIDVTEGKFCRVCFAEDIDPHMSKSSFCRLSYDELLSIWIERERPARYSGYPLESLTRDNLLKYYEEGTRYLDTIFFYQRTGQYCRNSAYLSLDVTTGHVICVSITLDITDGAGRDPETGFFNQNYFFAFAGALLESRTGKHYDIVCLFVKSYRIYQDRYGAEVCQRFLNKLAQILRDTFPKDVVIGRIENDQFALFFPDEYRDRMKQTIDRLALELKYSPLPGIQVKAGIYCDVCPELSIKQIYHNALITVLEIEPGYSSHFAEYNEAVRQKIYTEQIIRETMERGIALNEFQIVYQPKCRLDDCTVVGAEALSRWNHPQIGFIDPSAYIPIFERSGFLREFDLYVLEHVCSDLHHCMSDGRRAVPVSINLSPTTFEEDSLVQICTKIVDHWKVPHEFLHIEITEAAYDINSEKVMKTVQEFCNAGFRVELDDFGSGYSSLQTFAMLPIDIMKLDRSFASNLQNERLSAILMAVLQTLKHLSIPLVVEGIETREQLEDLKALVGDAYDVMVQGFYFSKPLPCEQFIQFTEQNQ